jgi:hypothetical protein
MDGSTVNAATSPTLPAEAQASSGAGNEAGPFRCVLDEQPGYLAPRRAAEPQTADASPSIVNSGCHFSWEEGTPDEVAESAAFLGVRSGDRVVWVPDAARLCWQPFWLGSALGEVLSRCTGGAPAPGDIPATAVRALRHAGIFLAAGQEQQAQQRESDLSKAAEEFRVHRHVSLAGLIHEFHIDALRKYYRRLVRSAGMYLGDGQTEHRYCVHNEPVSRFFHRQLTHAVALVAGCAVKPSYTYTVSYRGGAELASHTDREQCEFTLSLLLDYPPEREQESPWPLCLEEGGRTAEVVQNIGDALLFCGRELPHFRPRLPDGYTSTSLLLHYVREDFAGPLD